MKDHKHLDGERIRRGYGEIMPTLRRLTTLLQPYRRKIAILLILTASAAVVPLATPRLVGIAIDNGIVSSGSLPTDTGAIIAYCIVAIILVETLSYLLRSLKEFRTQFLAENICLDIRCRLFNHIERLPARFHGSHAPGMLSARVLDESRALEGHLMNAIAVLFVSPLSLIGIVFILSRIDWRIALWAFIPVPLLYALMFVYVRSMRKAGRETRDRAEDLSAALCENLSAAQSVQLADAIEWGERRFADRALSYRDARVEMAKIASRYFPAMGFFMGAGTIMVLIYGGYYLPAGRTISGGEIVSIIAYLAYFYGPVMSLTNANHTLQEAALSAERIFSILDQPTAMVDGGEEIGDRPPDIKLTDVSLSYAEGRNVLRNVNLTIRYGEKVGITGVTGAGKTTLMRLMARVEDPDSGIVEIGGLDVRRISTRALRRCVAVVMQEDAIFSASVRENIALGSGGNVERAAKIAMADGFIGRLPNGYDTVVGERGTNLSAGERQRLSLARALVREPKILILDEATSALDIATEESILSALFREMKDRTIIVISHRPTALTQCGKIYRLQDGAAASV